MKVFLCIIGIILICNVVLCLSLLTTTFVLYVDEQITDFKKKRIIKKIKEERK